jgi:hypothetical protein
MELFYGDFKGKTAGSRKIEICGQLTGLGNFRP